MLKDGLKYKDTNRAHDHMIYQSMENDYEEEIDVLKSKVRMLQAENAELLRKLVDRSMARNYCRTTRGP